MKKLVDGLKWFLGGVLSLVLAVLSLRFLSRGGEQGGNDKEAERVDSEALRADEAFEKLEKAKNEPIDEEKELSHEEFWKDKL